MLTDEQLAEIRDRAERATPGPWTLVYEKSLRLSSAMVKAGTNRTLFNLDPDKNRDLDEATHMVEDDLDFIQNARADVTALLEVIQELQARVQDVDTAEENLRDLQSSLATVASQNERMRAMLEFYAWPGTYRQPDPAAEPRAWIGNDLGRRARYVLGIPEPTPPETK